MSVETFKQHLYDAEIVDAQGMHSEFASGLHGQKIDFDKIERGSELYNEWVDVSSEAVERLRFDRGQRGAERLALIGVANGTNRLAIDVADNLGGATGLETYKDDSGIVRLTKVTKKFLEFAQPNLTILLEDVGTTGGSVMTPALEARQIVATRLTEVLFTWKRSQTVEKLRNAGVLSTAIIFEPLPNFRPDECATNPDGFCARGWELKAKTK